MVIIRRSFPILIPPYRGTLEPYDVTPLGGVPFPGESIVTYATFSWKGFNLTDEDGFALPIRGGLHIAGRPLLYPRGFSFNNTITPDPSLLALLDSNGIAGFTDNVNPGRQGFLPAVLEGNGFEAVDDGGSGTVVMATTLADRWKGGDALFIIQEGSYLKYWHYDNLITPTAVVTNSAMVAHDQDRTNGAQAAFERVQLIYWYLQSGATLESDIIAVNQAAAAGVANSEFHIASDQSEIDDSVLPAVQAFFGV